MVQGIRNLLDKIVWNGRDSRGALALVRQHMTVLAQRQGQLCPTWLVTNLDVLQQQPARVLCVTEMDLHEAMHHDRVIAWQDTNVIVIETYWQLLHYRAQIDPGRQYVLIMDTWIAPELFDRHFYWLKVLDRFYFKYDCLAVLARLSQNDAGWQPTRTSLAQRPYRTFSLIGRRDFYRTRFVDQLRELQLPGSRVKYNGDTVIDTGPDCDDRVYTADSFAQFGEPDLIRPFDVARAWYDHYRFETVIETTPWNTGVWPFPEYNISEKTLRPLMNGVPAVILAPQGYHAWLAQELLIDVSGGLWQPAADQEPNDFERMKAVVNHVQDLAHSLDQEPDCAVITRNRAAVVQMAYINSREVERCAQLLLDL